MANDLGVLMDIPSLIVDNCWNAQHNAFDAVPRSLAAGPSLSCTDALLPHPPVSPYARVDMHGLIGVP